jgi:hypothetical protein
VQATELVKSLIPSRMKARVLWVQGYQLALVKIDDATLPAVFDVLGSACIFSKGPLEYFHADKIRFSFGPGTAFQSEGSGPRSTPDGYFVQIVQTVDAGDIQEAADKVASVAGLLGAWGGLNAVYEQYFEYRLDIAKDQIGVATPSIINPLSTEITDFNRIPILDALSSSILSLPADDQARYRLSFRWFAQSLTHSGVDAFLELWIALESLLMEKTDIKPINELLSTMYSTPLKAVQKDFLVGRLQDFRSRIVHKGLRLPVHSLVTDYLQAIFMDSLFFKLIGRHENRSRSMLLRHAEELRRLLG